MSLELSLFRACFPHLLHGLELSIVPRCELGHRGYADSFTMVNGRCLGNLQRQRAMMTKVWVLLLCAIITFSGDAFGDDAMLPDQFGCANPETLYNILNLAEPSSAKRRAFLIAKNCMSLVGAHYLLVGEEDGLAKIRVFANLGDWRTSSIVFTLDEMLDPDDMLDSSAIAHQ